MRASWRPSRTARRAGSFSFARSVFAFFLAPKRSSRMRGNRPLCTSALTNASFPFKVIFETYTFSSAPLPHLLSAPFSSSCPSLPLPLPSPLLTIFDDTSKRSDFVLIGREEGHVPLGEEGSVAEIVGHHNGGVQ